MDIELLQTRLGHTLRNAALLQQALTHRSHSSLHNERLEFLGDSVLNFTTAELLYGAYPEADEGDLSRYRATLVSGNSLAAVAASLGLGDQLRLGSGELKAGGFRRASILADALEALIGAAFVDGGFEPALGLVQRLFGEVIATTEADRWSKDPKTELQEWLQARRLPVPAYRIVETRGQAHAQTFEVECAVPALSLAKNGEGRSRRAAEQQAAEAALRIIEA